jgi:hypothetical protein
MVAPVKSTVISRLALGLLTSATLVGMTVESASALPFQQILEPAASILGLNRDRNRTVAIPTEVGKENLNGNTFNFCVAPGPCGMPMIPPGGPVPTAGGAPPPPRRPGPVLLVPPIQIPSPF